MADENNSNDADSPTIPPKNQRSTFQGDRLDDRTGRSDDPTIAPHAATVKSHLTESVEGYELIEELGRGGMGVVYKARDTRLDREVALKMILGGQFASEEQILRFRHEAESVAQLDHPGIVPIYEIGESKGNHFFAMKFIEGGALDEAQQLFKSNPRKAVELVIEIAGAVHHAHQRGILHRDIKPANILLDLDGHPHVTDLGLAKQIDDQEGMTKTGSVMGSPGFMSPEQARGQSDLTTAVDIYSLGAILYWLISGRAPIEGDTHLEIILKTISDEPASLLEHAKDADRGLNLICQKALSKSPEGRYLSAADFGEDLQAWLEGDPLSVKPPTAIGIARLWLKRNARTLLASAGLGLVCGTLVGGIIFMLIASEILGNIQTNQAQLGDAGSAWVTEYFSWVGWIDRSILRSLPPLIVFITVSFGIAAIALIRPKSRELGMVVSTTAAMIAGVAAFMIGLGWSPVIKNGVNEGEQDIALMSNAFWMEPSERELAQRFLLQRYPGLESVELKSRGELLRQKIKRDQVLGIPQGMWIGIAETMCLCSLPLFFSATFSGLIWHRGSRGFEFVGKSIELAIYSALLFLMLTKYVSNDIGLYPGFWFQLLSCAGVCVALFLALSDKNVWWRIFAFVLVNLCVFSNFFESSRIATANRFAANATSTADFRDAAHFFQKQVNVRPDEFSRYQLGILYAYLGKDDAYRNQCEVLLAEFKNAYHPSVAERMAKLFLLKPEISGHQERIHQLAESVVGFRTSTGTEWFYACRALSELRKRDYDEVLIWTAKSFEAVKGEDDSFILLRSMNRIIEALAYRELGNQAAADKAIKAFQETNVKNGPSLTHWQDALVCKILYREWQTGQ